MTILSSLKKLHKKMTGQETNSKTIGGVLDSMQENYSGGTSGGESYETVAEISVGTMTEQGGMYIYSTNASAPVIDRNATYYLNDASYPNDDIAVEDGDTVIAFNTILGEQGRVDPLKPYIVFEWENGTLIVVSDTNDAENKTFTILKKVSSGGGSLPDPGEVGNVMTSTGDSWESAPPHNDADLYIEADIDGETWTFSEPSVEFATAFAAANAGKTVVLRATSGGSSMDIPLIHKTPMSLSFAGVFPTGVHTYAIGVVGFSAEIGLLFVDLVPVQPAIGQNDNGKILGVENGAYVLVDIGTVNKVYTDLTVNGTSVTADKSVQELVEAHVAGKEVIARMVTNGFTVELRVSAYVEDAQNNTYGIQFSNTVYAAPNSTMTAAVYGNKINDNDDNWVVGGIS